MIAMTTDARPVASASDYAECRQIMFRASKNYSFASRLLPQRILPHVEALYALMRVGDDRVDVSFEGFSSPLAAIEDWERDINAPYGVAFGSLSQGFFQSSYFRPHNKAHDIQGLYFVGQATYPGIGMPMVLLSAKLLQERLAQDYRL